MILRPKRHGLDASDVVRVGLCTSRNPDAEKHRTSKQQKVESNVLKKESMPDVADQNHIQTNMRGDGMNLRKLEVFLDQFSCWSLEYKPWKRWRIVVLIVVVLLVNRGILQRKSEMKTTAKKFYSYLILTRG